MNSLSFQDTQPNSTWTWDTEDQNSYPSQADCRLLDDTGEISKPPARQLKRADMGSLAKQQRYETCTNMKNHRKSFKQPWSSDFDFIKKQSFNTKTVAHLKCVKATLYRWTSGRDNPLPCLVNKSNGPFATASAYQRLLSDSPFILASATVCIIPDLT